MSYQFGPRDPSSELVEIIRQVRRRWRMKLALRGALGVVGVGLLVLVLSALRARVLALHARRHHHLPRHPGRRARGPGRLPARAAADAQRERRAGRALPRRARAVAAGGHHQRRRSGARRRRLAVLGDARAQARRIGGGQGARRSKAGAASSACRCAATALTLAGARRRRHRALRARSRVPAPRAVGALRRVARRRRRPRPIASRSRPATRRCRAARTRPSPRSLSGFDAEQASLIVRKTPGGRLRARRAPPRRRRQVRRHAVRSRRADRVISSRRTASAPKSSR